MLRPALQSPFFLSFFLGCSISTSVSRCCSGISPLTPQIHRSPEAEGPPPAPCGSPEPCVLCLTLALFPGPLSRWTSPESLASRTPGRLPLQQTPVPGRSGAEDPVSLPGPLASCVRRGRFQRQGHETVGEGDVLSFQELLLRVLLPGVRRRAQPDSHHGRAVEGRVSRVGADPEPCSSRAQPQGNRLRPQVSLVSGKPLSFTRKWGTPESGPLNPATTQQGPLLLP